ncbi:MAG: hypothetical protein ACFFD8_10220 [Candidatus Thorarchaeota archaeon]
MQYLIENSISFSIGIVFAISMLILTVILLLRRREFTGTKKQAYLLLSLALLFFGIGHIIWNLRAVFVPRFTTAILLLPYWQGFWASIMLSITFLGLWGLQLTRPEWYQNRKWVVIILFIPWIAVILNVLFLTDPNTAVIVCSALINDIQPNLFQILLVGLSLTLFIGLAFDYYYRCYRSHPTKLYPFIALLGLVLILFGGILETKVIPICQIITMGRILMLLGFWLTSIGILRITPLTSK